MWDAGNATLKQVIEHLSTLPADMPVAHGFGHPHSYRGYYEELAFEPVENTTAGAMLSAAKSAVGQTFMGWKGGEFTMREHTDCWLAKMGDLGVPIAFAPREVYLLPRTSGF